MAHNVCPEQADSGSVVVPVNITESPHLELAPPHLILAQSSCVQRKQAGWMANTLFLEKVGS